jgi:hypothetical protein
MDVQKRVREIADEIMTNRYELIDEFAKAWLTHLPHSVVQKMKEEGTLEGLSMVEQEMEGGGRRFYFRYEPELQAEHLENERSQIRLRKKQLELDIKELNKKLNE